MLWNVKNGRPVAAIPPRKLYLSNRSVFALFRAAAIAATKPAGPPPATTTSY